MLNQRHQLGVDRLRHSVPCLEFHCNTAAVHMLSRSFTMFIDRNSRACKIHSCFQHRLIMFLVSISSMFGYVWVSCITFRISKPLQQHTTLKHWFDQTILNDWVTRAKSVSETLKYWDVQCFSNLQVSVSCRTATLSWWVALSTDWISSGYCDCLDLDESIGVLCLETTTNKR